MLYSSLFFNWPRDGTAHLAFFSYSEIFRFALLIVLMLFFLGPIFRD
jgi:hypothetical protein